MAERGGWGHPASLHAGKDPPTFPSVYARSFRSPKASSVREGGSSPSPSSGARFGLGLNLAVPSLLLLLGLLLNFLVEPLLHIGNCSALPRARCFPAAVCVYSWVLKSWQSFWADPKVCSSWALDVGTSSGPFQPSLSMIHRRELSQGDNSAKAKQLPKKVNK